MRYALSFALAACGGPRGPVERPPAAVERPAAAPVRAVGGDVIMAGEFGIARVESGTPSGMVLTIERGRHLRLDGEWLYFFDPARPVLRAVHLHRRGTTRVVLELRPIVQPGFRGVDPLVFLRRQEDLDVRGGVLCMDLRREDLGKVYNVRIDLASQARVEGLVAGGSRACTPAGPSGDGLSIELGFGDVVPMTRGFRRRGRGGGGGRPGSSRRGGGRR